MTVDATTVKEGDEIPPLELTPDIENVKAYFSDARRMPPFFLDEAAARAQGLPGRLVPGPMKVGLLYGAVERWIGQAGYVRAVRAAHRRPDVQGNPITVVGQVARVYDEAGARRADLELLIINRDGQPSVRGFATVEFWPRP